MRKYCDKCGEVHEDMVVINYQNKAKICESCILEMFCVIDDAIHKETRVNSNSPDKVDITASIPSVDAIIKHLNKTIVGQVYAKETIAIAIRNHYKRMCMEHETQKMVEKSNILLFGPSGSGKSALLKSVAEFIDTPLVIVDAYVYTTSGYVGSDVEDIISELYEKSGKNKAKTERGIVFLDEIDKKKKSRGNEGRVEPGGEQAQQAFLKLVEGKEVTIDKKVTIDTSNILFIAGGAFVGLSEIVGDRNTPDTIGFVDDSIDPSKILENAYANVTTEDLITFGMIPEFVGRFPVITYTKELTKEEIVEIIKTTDNSIVNQYKELLAMSDDLELYVTSPAIETIAEMVIKDKIGVRGIRKVFENILHDVQRDAESIKRSGGKKIVINKSVITEGKSPSIEHSDGKGLKRTPVKRKL